MLVGLALMFVGAALVAPFHLYFSYSRIFGLVLHGILLAGWFAAATGFLVLFIEIMVQMAEREKTTLSSIKKTGDGTTTIKV